MNSISQQSAQQYEGPDLMARLAGVQPLQTLSGARNAGIIAATAKENGLDKPAPQTPAPTEQTAQQGPEQAPEQGGWGQILGSSPPAGPSNSMGGA